MFVRSLDLRFEAKPRTASAVRRDKAHGQPRAGCFGVAAQPWRRTATPARPPAARPRTGSCRAVGQAPPASVSPPCGRGFSASMSAYSSSARAYSSVELGILHEARLQILQLRHVVTCLIRSLAVARARRGVLRDFFAKTCSTTTRRPHRRHVDPPSDTTVCPHPKFPELPVEMPDMRCAKSLQPDTLHRLQQPKQPGAQRHWQGCDFGVDGRYGFDRPIHPRHIAHPL